MLVHVKSIYCLIADNKKLLKLEMRLKDSKIPNNLKDAICNDRNKFLEYVKGIHEESFLDAGLLYAAVTVFIGTHSALSSNKLTFSPKLLKDSIDTLNKNPHAKESMDLLLQESCPSL